MKKNLFLILAILASVLTFNSCTNEAFRISEAIDNSFNINAMVDGQVATRAAKETTSLSEFDLIMNTASWKSSNTPDTYTVSAGAVTSTNTVYYWPNSTDVVTFRATAAPTAWATATITGISKTGYTTGMDNADDPVVAVSATAKTANVPMTFYHALSRITLHYAGTNYETVNGDADASKGIYIVPKSHYFVANTTGDFTYNSTTLDGKWTATPDAAKNYLLADAWTNVTTGNTYTQSYTVSGGIDGTKPEKTTNEWTNVIPGAPATTVVITIDVCNASDGTVITADKVLTLTLPTLHNHADGTTCPKTQHPGDVNDFETDGALETFGCNAVAGTVSELTGGKYQPGYGYIYDVRFYVKKTVDDGDPSTDDGTDDDYDINPIIIGTISVDPWLNNHAGEIIYGK